MVGVAKILQSSILYNDRYNYGEGEGSVVTTTKLHWHAHAVSDVCFSSDGTYLLTGGEEGVLVQWQLETGGRHFRPRLGAPVVGVACCPGDRVFGVSLANNGKSLNFIFILLLSFPSSSNSDTASLWFT